jgi:hypothetical protein
MYKRFYDDVKLAKCLKRHIKAYGKFTNMRTPFFMYGRFFWNTATNFAPMRAKALFEQFCPKGGVVTIIAVALVEECLVAYQVVITTHI